MKPLTLNSTTRLLDLHFSASWRGAWLVETELDLDPSLPMPTGALTVNVFDQDLQGTVEPTGSGRFAHRAKLRIVGGKNGWNQSVVKRDFHNDATVKIADVVKATAAEIGETVVEVPATQLAVDYVRRAGQASRVLAGLDWYVDFAGQTHVASRPPATAGPDVEVLDYDPLTRTLELGAVTSLVLPGMTFTDPNGRWEGTLTVRDVEQHFTAEGEATATAFCGDSASGQGPRPLFERFVLEVVQPEFLRTYPYRLVDQGVDGRLTLQAIATADGIPDTILISAWPGVPGASATFDITQGDIVVLGFRRGDPSQPYVVSYSPELVPLTLLLAVTTKLELASSNGPAVARVGDGVNAGYLVLTSVGGVSAYFPGDVPPSVVNQQLATAAAALLSPPGTMVPLTGGVITSGSSKVSSG